MGIDFNGSTLFISARSPFARRVRVAFLEQGISFQEHVCDVFHPTEELVRVNPLARVPALRLASGQILVDSNLILQFFYENVTSPLGPRIGSDRAEFLRWSALSSGFAEKVVEYFLETQRSPDKQDVEIEAELKAVSERVLTELENTLSAKKGEGLVGGAWSQVDLDMGVVLAYFNLRYSEAWRSRYPHVNTYLITLEERPSFQKTRPPRQ